MAKYHGRVDIKKTYKVPRVFMIILSIIMLVTLFIPMISIDDRGRDNLSHYPTNKAITEIRKALAFGDFAEVQISDSEEKPSDYYEVSYFDYALLAQKIDNKTEQKLFFGMYKKTTSFSSVSETYTGTMIIGLWLPFAVAVLAIFWSLLSNSFLAFINSLLAVATGYLFGFFFDVLGTVNQSLYSRTFIWDKYNPFFLVSIVMLLVSFWFMISRHDYKSNIRYAKKLASRRNLNDYDDDLD